MKKLIVIGVTTLAAMFVALGVAPSAYAYPETSCNVTVNAQKAEGGTILKVHATSQQITTDDGLGRAAADSVNWRAEFNGTVREANTDVFDTTFTLPKVSSETSFLLTVQAVMPDATTTCEKSLNITVVPGGTDVNPPGELPNTGGPRMILLVAGLGLVAMGGVAIRQSRRRHEGVTA